MSPGPTYRLAKLLQRLLALAYLAAVLSRVEWGSAFGARSGTNKARISPLPVMILGGQYVPQIKESRMFSGMLNDVAKVLCVPGEFGRDIGLIPGKKKRRKKGKDDEIRSPKPYMERCGKWARGLKDVSSVVVVVGPWW